MGSNVIENEIQISFRRKFTTFFLDYATYIIGAAMFLFFSLTTDAFLSVSNMLGVLRDSMPMFLTAAGMTFALLGKQMDMSLAANLMLSSSIGAMGIAHWGWNPWVGLVAAILIGAAVGFLNALLVVRFKMNGWLTTLAMQLVLKGVCWLITSSATILMNDEVQAIASATFAGLPAYVIVSILLVVVAQLIISYSVFGRNLIAKGCNAVAAEKIGINISQLTYGAYILAGAFAAVSGVMMFLNMGQVGPSSGKGYEFLCCMCCVLGGTSLYGGRGSVLPGALIGVLIVMFLENGLYIMGVNPYIYGLIRGAILFLAMLIDSIKNKER